MTGISRTTFPFKPLPSRHISLCLSSLHSNKLFGLRLNFPISSSYLEFAISVSHKSIAARYGGGSGAFSRPNSGDFRQSQQGNSDDDQALDISSIRSENVRLIDDKQNMIGIVSKGEALQRADDAELDLVILSPDADPPVVRLMDYNPSHGFEGAENGVKVIVNLKGRESDFRNNAIELIRRFRNDIGELAVEESKSFRERSMTLVLVPNKAVVQKAPESTKKKEKTASEVSAGV